MLRLLTAALVFAGGAAAASVAAAAAGSGGAAEVNLRLADQQSKAWQAKELKALMKSDAAKLKNQLKLERMFALASANGGHVEKAAGDKENVRERDTKKKAAKAAERLRAEVEGAGSGSTSTTTTTASPPRQDKEDPGVSVVSVVDDVSGFDLPPESMSRGVAGGMRTTPTPVEGGELQPPYAQGTRSGYHLYETSLSNPSGDFPSSPPHEQVEVSGAGARYLAGNHGEYLASGSPRAAGGSHIRVVFNNNPQFIIGRTAGHSDPLPVASVHGHPRLGQGAPQDDYNPAESAPGETKVPAQPPCAKERGLAASSHQSLAHMEMINLKAGPVEEAPEVHTSVRQPMSPPPPAPQLQLPVTAASGGLAGPPVIASSRPLDLASALNGAARPSRPHPDDEQVHVPLEEAAKSNFRPPLRMVISMRNKEGDLMKLPINLQGSQGAQGSFFELGPKMRVHFEPAAGPVPSFTGGPLDKLSFVDDNTPIGGDVFDPANVRPFAKIRPRSREEAPPPPPAGRLGDEPARPPTAQVTPVAKVPVAPTEQSLPVPGKALQGADEPPQPPQRQPGESQEKRGRDCDHDHEPPIFMPPTNLFQNRTLASMFVEFQRALTEQMQMQQQQFAAGPAEQQPLQVSNNNNNFLSPLSPQLQQQQPQLQPPPPPQTGQEQGSAPLDSPEARAAQQFHEQQEDLVVAMMAANATNPASIEPGKQMSMTVITPPRGTSLAEAIRMHAGDTEERTVAILHSSSGRQRQSVASVASAAPGISASDAASFAPSIAEEHSRPFPVDVQLRKPPVSAPAPVEPQSQPQDPDVGFASAATSLDQRRHHHQQHHHQNLARRWPFAGVSSLDYEPQQLYYQPRHQTLRYKRSAREFAGQLEPADRLATVAAAATAASAGRRAAGTGNGTTTTPPPQDPVAAAASEEHQNEVESDVDSAADSSEEEPSSSSGSDSDLEARSDADLDGDSSEADLDDTPDESAEFDSDDEPYNQAASSSEARDYATPAFEIPQIDLSADSLRQKGCRTVLREVQEIPLEAAGLETRRADGSVGSGFVPGTPANQTLGGRNALVRTRRGATPNASRANLINSRKVTSIVMTKECLFPDGESGSTGSNEDSRLAPGLQVGSLGIGPQQSGGAGVNQDWSERGAPKNPAVPASNLRRRSVPASERDFYVVSDSRRNEVAHKMYKPPSDSNPYHSLVYTSKNGADPDSEPDEPSEADEEETAAAARGGSRPRLLSARERAALQDPEHDDTDPAPESLAGGKDEEDSSANQADRRRSSELQVPQPKSFGKSLRVEHSLGRRRPQQGSLSQQLARLRPGLHAATEQGGGQQVVATAARRADNSEEDSRGAADDAETEDGDEPQADAEASKSREARADEEDSEPDADPDYNPKESRLTRSGKPKRTNKSFAYVHRNAPPKSGRPGKGGAAGKADGDDFVVSYGRGNVQTEHEDYDSERDSGPPPASLRNRRAPTSGGSALRPQFGARVQQQPTGVAASGRRALTLVG